MTWLIISAFAVSSSIDNLSVGMSYGIRKIDIRLGAGLLGLSPLAIALTAAIGSFISVWAGVNLGSRLAVVRIGSFTVGQFGTLLSGVIILIIAFTAFCRL